MGSDRFLGGRRPERRTGAEPATGAGRGLPRPVPEPAPLRGSIAVAVARALADLVLPGTCAGCGRDSLVALCGECAAALQATPALARPSPPPPGLPPPYAVTAYEDPVRAAIVAHKDEGRRSLAGPLGDALAAALVAAARAVEAARADDDLCHRSARVAAASLLVVPVPSSRGARRRRGSDPLGRLARRAVTGARSAGAAVVLVDALRHARRVADQAGLGAAARADNLAGALVVRPSARRRVAGARVVLVDDVVTTGATLAEAARAVRAAGGWPAAAATVAATRRRAPGPVAPAGAAGS